MIQSNSKNTDDINRSRGLDRIDRNILRELQNDGRLSNVELSKRVGLSPTPCLERVRRFRKKWLYPWV